MSYTPVLLGGFSGITIFLGLPLAFLKNLSSRARGFMTAMSTGILVFLLVEITHGVMENIEDLSISAAGGFHVGGQVFLYVAIFAIGLFTGLMGLVWFENKYIHSAKDIDSPQPEKQARKLAMMIAIGLGLHNLSEGLAIGQAYSWGNASLGLLLVVGFALHNATEGFGIAAPMAGTPTSWSYLGLLGLIGGGPTLLGAFLGTLWTIKPIEIFCLSLASGSILYIIGELLHLGRKMKEETTAAAGLLVGFFLAFATELLINISSGGMGKS